MTVIIVDQDCRDLLSGEAFAQLRSIRDAQVATLERDILEANQFDFRALLPEAFRNAAVDRVLLLTRMSGGVKRHHTQLIAANPQLWFISVLDVPFQAYRSQIAAEFDRILLGQGAEYAILFDTADHLAASKEMMKEDLPEKPECIILYRADRAYAERLAALLQRRRPDWAFFCGEYGHKYARRVILTGRQPEDFAVTPLPCAGSRVSLWVESPLGFNRRREWQRWFEPLSIQLDAAGWQLPDLERQTWFGILDFEELKTQIDCGEASPRLLQNSGLFVAWDEFGLPLTYPAVEDDEAMYRFLNRQCSLDELFDGGRQKK